MIGRFASARHGRDDVDLSRLFAWLNAPAPTPGARILEAALARDALRLPLPECRQ